MKKNNLIIISAVLLFLLVLAGCNLDATQGIMREVSNSTPSIGLNILNIAGYDKDTRTAYFISDEGLCRQTAGGSVEKLISNTNTMQIKEATLATTATGKKIYFTAQNPEDGTTAYKEYDLTADPIPYIVAAGARRTYNAGFEIDVTADGRLKVSYQYAGGAISEELIAFPITLTQIQGFQDASTGKSSLLLTWLEGSDKAKKAALFTFDGAALNKFDLTLANSYYNFASYAYNPVTGNLVLIGRDKYIYYVAGLTAGTNQIKASSTSLSSATFSSASPSLGFCDETAADDESFVIKSTNGYIVIDTAVSGEDMTFTHSTTTSGFAKGMVVTVSGMTKIDTRKVLVFTQENGLYVMDIENDSVAKF